jgi:hypothetical protein
MTGVAAAVRPLNTRPTKVGALVPAHRTIFPISFILSEDTHNQNDVILSAAKDPRILRGSPVRSVILSAAQSAKSKDPCILPGLPALLALIAVLALATIPAHAQGCAQCLDSTRATPPAVQAAYRHAIELLIGAASTIFIIGLILLRREP